MGAETINFTTRTGGESFQAFGKRRENDSFVDWNRYCNLFIDYCGIDNFILILDGSGYGPLISTGESSNCIVLGTNYMFEDMRGE